jgi:hypothetical protein
MLAENPRDRYPTARAALAALQSFSSSPATAANSPTPISSAPSAPTLAPTPPTEMPVAEPLQPEFLQHCRREFIRCVGPMADYILEDLLAQIPPLSAAKLIEHLTAEIPDAQQASQFKAQAVSFLQQLSITSQQKPAPTRSSSNPKPPAKTGAQSTAPSSSSARTSPLAEANPAFLECCRRELARQIGPMAMYMIDDVLAQSPQLTAQQFVTVLAAEIPDARQAEAFKRQLLAELS